MNTESPGVIFVGIDLGTTGCRVVAIDGGGDVQAHAEAPVPAPLRRQNQITQDPEQWWQAVVACLRSLLQHVAPERVNAIAIDGTSGTLLLCDSLGVPVTPALLYNDSRAQAQAAQIAGAAVPESGGHGATSSLAKLLWLQAQKRDRGAAHALHQADWIAGRLTGRWGHSDDNNCLKLGYDAAARRWPDWFARLGVNTALLPAVHAPGTTLGPVSTQLAADLGLSADTRVVAGTTDGVAAFLAAGANRSGHGVTSLGSTLVLKLLSDGPIFSPEHGVYSHRLGNYWLAGGASNSGGAVLLQYFTIEQIEAMTPLLDPEHLTGLDYYPLPAVGERFPVNDPDRVAQMEPRPENSVRFFQAMLEGIARIEAQGYRLLAEMGAPKVTEVRTTGGGANNAAWTRIREKILGIPLVPARSGMAAYGTALLAQGVVEKNFS